MLEVLSFVEDPDLSGSAATVLSQLNGDEDEDGDGGHDDDGNDGNGDD